MTNTNETDLLRDAGENPPVSQDGEIDEASNFVGSPKIDDGASQAEDVSDDTSSEAPIEEEPETFPRSYVEKLRKENAGYRAKAKRADELAARLHSALVAADGRLADPADLEFNADHIDDPEALDAAIGELIAKKPGLRARQLGGNIGQGKRGTSSPKPTTDLISIIRDMQG